MALEQSYNLLSPLVSKHSNYMNNYMLTPPPSSNEDDSPQPIYFLASPSSTSFLSPDDSFSAPPTNMDTNLPPSNFNNGAIRLQFVEEPVDRFRFRYKSEMAGTHGSLNGVSSYKQRQQTFPTVELKNFNQTAVIRCSIYQCRSKSDAPDEREELYPHAHRLIRKYGREERDDPHEIEVSQNTGYQAVFTSMGIIHTAKKHVFEELRRKMEQLKREEVARKEGKFRELNDKEKLDMKSLAEEKAKTINLNIVCLRFDAFVKNSNGILHPLCPPLYSKIINNLKSALTGELKIVRMDRCSSPADGNQEVFIFVERVTKKNIKIRFYELDDNGDEVWTDYGKFNDSDVHHQFAIAFKTPRYQNQDITSQVKVYMELVRPSDNARSESKEFSYTPNFRSRSGAKRARYASSTCYSSGSDFDAQFGGTSADQRHIPLPVEESLSDIHLTSKEFSDIVNIMNSDPRSITVLENAVFGQQQNATDDSCANLLDLGMAASGSAHMPSQWAELVQYSYNKPVIVAQMADEVAVAQMESFGNYRQPKYEPGYQPIHNLSNFSAINYAVPESESQYMQPGAADYYTGFSQSFDGGKLPSRSIKANSDLRKAVEFLNELNQFVKTSYTDERAVEFLNHYLNQSKDKEPTNNALHVFISEKKWLNALCIIEFIKKYKQNHIFNLPNADNETALHIAVHVGNYKIIEKLLQSGANLHVLDDQCNTPLHTAVLENSSVPVLDALLSSTVAKKIIDETNADGYSALHLAVRNGNLPALKLLSQKGADINLRHASNGFTPLRFAVDAANENILRFILSHSSLQPLIPDFADVTPFHVAYDNQSSKIFPIIAKYMEENNYNVDVKEEKMEEISEEEPEMEVDIPFVAVKKEEIKDIDDLYENVTNFSDACLSKLSELLDKSENWSDLADSLNLGHYVRSGLIQENQTKSLLNFALEENHESVLNIRNCLEKLHEVESVQVIDDFVKKMQI